MFLCKQFAGESLHVTKVDLIKTWKCGKWVLPQGKISLFQDFAYFSLTFCSERTTFSTFMSSCPWRGVQVTTWAGKLRRLRDISASHTRVQVSPPGTFTTETAPPSKVLSTTAVNAVNCTNGDLRTTYNKRFVSLRQWYKLF